MVAFAAASCRHNDPEIINEYVDIEYDTSQVIDEPACFLTYGEPWIFNALAERFTNIVYDPSEASIIICTTADLKAHEEDIVNVLEDGGVVMEVRPDVSAHIDWFEGHGYYTSLVSDGRQYLIVAATRNSTFTLNDVSSSSDLLSSTEIETEELGTDGVTIGEEDSRNRYKNTIVNDIMSGQTLEYGRIHINNLIDWVDGEMEKKGLFTAGTADVYTELADDIAAKRYGFNLHHQFEVKFSNFEIASIIFSDPDTKTCSSTIEMDVNVIPIYAYNATNDPEDAGDYYYFKCTMVAHNAPLFSTRSIYHGGVETYYHAFYMRDFRYRFSLIGPDGNPCSSSYDVVFEHYPVPETTQGQTSYTSGFSKALNVSGNAGVANGKFTGGITVGGTWTWSDSQTRQMSDTRVELVTDATTKSILWSNHIENLQEDDDVNKAVPAIARTDQRWESSWCWHVKGLKDGDKTRFCLRVEMLPYFGYTYRHTTWYAEGHICQTTGEVQFPYATFAMGAPDREEKGVVKITNTDSERYMYQLEFYDSKWNLVYEDKTPVPQDESVSIQLPSGEYHVLFNKANGDTGESSRWAFRKPIEIKTGLTSVYSTLDASEVKE